jgi:6,7-dimethyl-8-ribityllumazine synthase
MATLESHFTLPLPVFDRPVRLLIVVAPFYRDIADNLIAGARATAAACGAEVDLVEVPGALEVPTAIAMAERIAKFDGYVALGCIIRGETTHYDTVCNDSSRALSLLGLQGACIGNGILTVENHAQAAVRALLLDRGLAAAREGKDFIEVAAHAFGGRAGAPPMKVSVREILDIAGDVDGQIYMRDFKLIDQSDMIVSLVPELPGGVPGLSSGVERELHHAWEHTKEVYVVWKPRKAPSPFITETATKIFRSVDEALSYFESKGMMAPSTLFGH